MNKGYTEKMEALHDEIVHWLERGLTTNAIARLLQMKTSQSLRTYFCKNPKLLAMAEANGKRAQVIAGKNLSGGKYVSDSGV